MEEKIRKIISEQLSVFHPDVNVPCIRDEDDIIKLLPFTSFEWMVVICKIEEEFGVTLRFAGKKSLTIKEAVHLIKKDT